MSRRAGKVRLGDVLSVKARIGWQGLTQKEHRETGEYNLVTGTDFVDGKVDFSKCVFVDKERYDQDENIQLRNGDLLITKDGTIGKVAVVENMPRPATLNSGVFVVRDVTSSFFIRYLYHFFLAPEFRKLVDGKLTGCTIAHLNQKVLVNLTIPLPPLSAQQRIADELDRLCALKKNAEDRLAILDQIVKSRFVEMFGDPVQNNRGWPLAHLQELATKIGSGATPKGGKSSYAESGVSFIRSMNVHDARFKYDDLAYLTDSQAKELSNVEVRSLDVLLNITGASVARSCVVPYDVLPARVNQHVAIVRPVQDKLDSYFLNAMFISGSYKRLLLNLGDSNGATRQAITKGQIENLALPLPPIGEQRKFAAFMAEVDKSELTLRETVATLDQLYRAKLQEYFG